MNDDSILQLKLLGKGGQGLLLLSKIIGKILTEQLNYNVSIKTAYDSAVRRGEVDIDLIASADRISY
jgi:Pyruvate/2-oxoacid:ferredoxin oxidoreductase gamma subunit